jgi:hypothetical protein
MELRQTAPATQATPRQQARPTPPQYWQLPYSGMQKRPPPQVDPGQHGPASSPQARQVPLWQTSEEPQLPPMQQGWLGPPHCG